MIHLMRDVRRIPTGHTRKAVVTSAGPFSPLRPPIPALLGPWYKNDPLRQGLCARGPVSAVGTRCTIQRCDLYTPTRTGPFEKCSLLPVLVCWFWVVIMIPS